jgi:hypothetical protein
MKKQNVAVSLLVALGAVSTQAHAASAAETALTSIGTEITALSAAAWPIVTSLVIAFVGMKLFKKFANKAS